MHSCSWSDFVDGLKSSQAAGHGLYCTISEILQLIVEQLGSFAKAWETAIIEAEFPHASNINRSINSQRDNQILDTVRRFSEICFGRCSSRSLRHPESCFYSVKFSWCASAKKVRFEPCLFLARFQELLLSETLLFSTFKKRPFIWLVVATEYRS